MKQTGFPLVQVLLATAFVGALLVLLALPFVSLSEPKLTLEAKQWACQKTEPRRYSYLTMIGKVPVTNYSTRDECVEWKRAGE